MAWNRAAATVDSEILVARRSGVIDRLDADSGRIVHQYGGFSGSSAFAGVDATAAGCATGREWGRERGRAGRERGREGEGALQGDPA